MAAHIGNHLGGLKRVRLLAVIHLAVIHTGMLDGAHDAEFQALLVALDTAQERCLTVAVPRTAQAVTYAVAEGGNARHLTDVGFHSQLFAWISATACTPALAIDENVLGHGCADSIHRLDVMHAHQVKAETVDVVLLHPIFHALDHITAHGFTFTGGLVAAAAAVAVGAVGILAVKVVGPSQLEVAAVDVPGVVIYYIQNDLDAGLVECLHHLLELVDAHLGLVGIGGVATLGHVIVHRVITPVILRLVEAGLIDRGIVKRRQDVDGIHAQFLQVTDGARLGQGEVLTLVDKATRLVDGKVAVVHLIQDKVLGGNAGTFVGTPASRVGVGHVNDGATLAVHSHGGCPDTRALSAEFAAILHIKGVELTLEVALNGGLPDPCLGTFHVDGLDRFAAQAVLVDAQFDLLGIVVGLYREITRAGGIGDPGASVHCLWYE